MSPSRSASSRCPERTGCSSASTRPVPAEDPDGMADRGELIRLQAVEKRYGGERVLRVDHLVLRDGETVAVTGRNGSGKSTLGRIVAGAALAERGEVGRSPALTGPVGFLPQHGG